MTFLPVVERELRVASRRRGTHWMRFFAALVVVVVGFVLLVGAAHNTPSHRLALLVFRATTLIGFGFCLLAGTFLTADCLSSERRDGTLGLLFLTDLRGYDVVLGKLTATSAVAAYAVLAILPMVGLPLLMGGVTPGEFGRMCLALLVTLILSLSSGMFVSALSRETRTAMMGSFTIMLALTGGLFLIGWCLWAVARINVDLLLTASPLGAYLYSFDAGRITQGRYWIGVSLLSGLALAQLAAASWWLPRVWQENKPERRRPASARRLVSFVTRHAALFANPFTWLATRDGFPRLATRVGLWLLFLSWLVVYVASYGGGVRQEECAITCMFWAFGLHVLVKGLVAVQASRRFSEDRASGVLELLLVTPLSARMILAGQWTALRRQFTWLLCLLFAVNFLMMLRFLIPDRMSVGRPDQFTFSLIFLGGMAMLYADYKALGWTGMWLGLRGFKHHRAVLGALLRVLVAPWGIVFLFVFLSIQGRGSREAVTVFFVIWTMLSLAIAAVQVTRIRSALLYYFRRLAAGDALPEPPPPWQSEIRPVNPPAVASASRLP